MNSLIDQPTDDSFMNEALRLARKAFAQEEVPVGARALIAAPASYNFGRRRP